MYFSLKGYKRKLDIEYVAESDTDDVRELDDDASVTKSTETKKQKATKTKEEVDLKPPTQLKDEPEDVAIPDTESVDSATLPEKPILQRSTRITRSKAKFKEGIPN